MQQARHLGARGHPSNPQDIKSRTVKFIIEGDDLSRRSSLESSSKWSWSRLNGGDSTALVAK